MSRFVVRGFSLCGGERLVRYLDEYFDSEDEAHAFFQECLKPHPDAHPYEQLGWGEVTCEGRGFDESESVEWQRILNREQIGEHTRKSA